MSFRCVSLLDLKLLSSIFKQDQLHSQLVFFVENGQKSQNYFTCRSRCVIFTTTDEVEVV